MLTDVQSLSCRLAALLPLVVAVVVLHPLLLPVEANINKGVEFQDQEKIKHELLLKPFSRPLGSDLSLKFLKESFTVALIRKFTITVL